MINIEDMLGRLSKKRPVFHSEDDFKHALAWKIHEDYPELNIRLEKPVTLGNHKIHIDVFVYGKGASVAIETKYKTKRANIIICGEKFGLECHKAHTDNRHRFVQDISRLERCVKKCHADYGFAIFLTNDSNYWDKPTSSEDGDFRIHHNRVLQGKLIEGERMINLAGIYKLNWADYSNLSEQRDSPDENGSGKFKYLLVQVM